MKLTDVVVLVGLCLVTGPATAFSQGAREDAITNLLDNLFTKYDKRVRPGIDKREPLTVQVSAYVLDLFDVDENNHEFTINMYFRHHWIDPRLTYRPPEAGFSKLVLDVDHAKKVWIPDTFFTNERKAQHHSVGGVLQEMTHIKPEGDIIRSTRLTISAACKMNLGYHPFDRQRCSIEIESYAHTASDFVYEWKYGHTRKSVGVSSEASSLKYSIGGVNLRTENVGLSSGNYSRLALEFFLIRSSTREVQDRYFPAFVLTSVSFFTLVIGTFLIRTQMSLAILATMVIFMNLNAASMPKVSYQTALDLYIFVCFLVIVNVVIVNFLMQYFYRSTRPGSPRISRMQRLEEANHGGGGSTRSSTGDDKEVFFDDNGPNRPNNPGPQLNSRFEEVLYKLCNISKYSIPIGFLAFNVIYWMVVLIGSSTFPDDFLIMEDRDT